MTLGSIAVQEVLLLLKIGFLVLLYLFIWRVVRTASKDLRGAPQAVSYTHLTLPTILRV